LYYYYNLEWGAEVRRTLVGLCVALLGYMTVACNPLQEQQYTTEGIGNSLSWSGMREATELQDAYYGYLCYEARLPVSWEGGSPRCVDATFSPTQWGVFVQAGMNDIDLRCDSYLAWLDNRRRSAAPILQEITDLHTATANIMMISGVSANPIAIVGNAFSLASGTFTNLNSRLLFDIDKSTVQALVLGMRNRYRVDIAAVSIPHRPAATHALRSYLNICTPFFIETGINTTVAVYQQAGSAALDNSSLINAGTAYYAGVQARQPISKPVRTVVQNNPYCSILQGDCSAVDPAYVRSALRGLCARGGGGSVTSTVRTLISVYESSLTPPRSHTGKLSNADLARLSDLGECKEGILNYFENRAFKAGPDSEYPWLNKLLNVPPGTTLRNLRPVIQEKNLANTLAFSGGLEAQFTPELARILKGKP
jgi:hypothetical protein